MQLKNSSAFGNITDFISTNDPRPTEKPDQPQKSLGHIAFCALHPKANDCTISDEIQIQWEQAALYLLEQSLEKIVKVYSTYGNHALGSHLYVALTEKNYLKWGKEPTNTKEIYDFAARQVIKAILLRAITLQQQRIDDLFENPSLIEEQSLGQIAYATRFPQGTLKPRPSWENAAQYLLYVWYQKTTKDLRGFDDLPWSAHLYVGITSSINQGYEAWNNEPTQLQEDYQIASVRVFNAVFLRVIPLQQQRVNGQPSPESLFPSDS